MFVDEEFTIIIMDTLNIEERMVNQRKGWTFLMANGI